MIKKSVLKRFVKANVAPHFPDFHLDQGPHLVRICRPLLHGIVFEPAGKDDFYTTCFVHFLTIRDDFLSIGFGDRILRPNGHQTHKVSPPAGESSQLLADIRRSRFSPSSLHPTCENVLALANPQEEGAFDFFGLATCAVFENDPGLARHYLNLSRERMGPPIYDWRKKLLAEIEEIEDGLDDLAATQMKLRQWVEETIRLLGMQKFG